MWAPAEGEDAAPSQDGKLSGAARKKLKGSTFCGPNRSFPVPDCDHVTAAKRLLGRAKVGQATKDKIHACVDRKAKSLGCGGEKKDAAPAAAVKDAAPDPIREMVKDAKNGDAIVKHIDATRALHDKIEDENEKSMFRSSMGACMEVLSAEGWLSYMKGRLTAKDEILVNKLEYDSLHDGVEAYDADRKKLQDSIAVLRQTNVALLKDQKRALATQIVMYSVLSGEVGFKGLTADQVKDEIAERATRQLVSLQDALSDLIKKLDLAVPAGEKLTDTAPIAPKPVDDKTIIADAAEQPQEPTPGSKETPRGDGVALPVATLDDLRSMRQSASVATYRRLKSDSK